MTNHEYERASVQAAIGLMKPTAVDEQIEQVESTRVFLLHSRREIVNHYDLNKPELALETKESLEKWIAELESQPHLSLKEERYLAVMKELLDFKRHGEHMEELRQHYLNGHL